MATTSLPDKRSPIVVPDESRIVEPEKVRLEEEFRKNHISFFSLGPASSTSSFGNPGNEMFRGRVLNCIGVAVDPP